MTKVRIESIQPDGLIVTFEDGFIFNTWQEAFNFIIAVEKATGWRGEVKIE